MSRQRALLSTARVCAIGLALGACAELPNVPLDVCGNGVVDKDEDCDTFSEDERFICRPKGVLGECRFDCSLGPNNKRAPCPTGWSCDESGLCREPTGSFASEKAYEVGPVASLAAGDFDGDGRDDIVAQGPTDALERGELAFHFFDERGALAETRAFPKLLTSPVFADLSADGKSDLLFSNYGVGLLLGRTDRRLVPETFSSYRLPDTAVRLVGVHEDYIRNAVALITLGGIEGTQCVAGPDSNTGKLRCLHPLPGPIEDSVGDPVTGPIIEDAAQSPCAEIVLALRGASSFWLYDVCDRDPVMSDPRWREQAVQHEVSLAPAAEIDAPPQIVDMNGDGHLDVLIGAGGRAYVAHGDGTGLAPAVPYSFELEDFDRIRTVTEMPLAAGDFTGDGAVDFVFEDELIVSFPRFGGGPARYQVTSAILGAPLTVARIADLNADGRIDVVAASSLGLGIDIFSGTGSPYLTETSIPTQEPVLFLGVGDFDGDLTNDLAFVEQAAADETRDSLSMAFGVVGRPPQNAVPVARLADPEQLSVCRWRGRGNLLVASQLWQPSHVGTVTWLDGSPDRIPFAPHTLVSFSDDGQVSDYPALALLAGAFSGRGHADVIALSAGGDSDFQFWLLTDLETGQSTPLRLVDGLLDADYASPVRGVEEGDATLQLARVTADLDQDGRDESLWAMPTKTGRCAILAFDISAQSPASLVRFGEVEIDEACSDPKLATFDADGDGAIDLLLLTGARGGADRKLSVLWNDRRGRFANSNRSQVNDAHDLPEAFATLPESTVRRRSIVYVTEREALLVNTGQGARTFEAPQPLVALRQGRGVTSADINGDGAEDLVFADGNKLSVLLAELKTP